MKLKKSRKILDMGCGTGTVAKLIADKLSAASCGCAIGIDAAGKMIEGAEKTRQ